MRHPGSSIGVPMSLSSLPPKRARRIPLARCERALLAPRSGTARPSMQHVACCMWEPARPIRPRLRTPVMRCSRFPLPPASESGPSSFLGAMLGIWPALLARRQTVQKRMDRIWISEPQRFCGRVTTKTIYWSAKKAVMSMRWTPTTAVPWYGTTKSAAAGSWAASTGVCPPIMSRSSCQLPIPRLRAVLPGLSHRESTQ